MTISGSRPPRTAAFIVAFCSVALSSSWQPAQAAYSDDTLIGLPAHEVIPLLCSKKVTAVQYATALIKQAEAYSCINAFAAFKPSTVLADAAAIDKLAAAGKDVRPPCGFPFAVKDNIDVLGYPTVGGTPALEGKHPTKSSPIVDQLLNAHGVVMGKMRMHELAYGTTSINPHYGPVLNPYNNTMHVGGSSGGTAAMIAARGVAAGFCSDTGGSCRIPGSMNGIVGFRPTIGCYDAADGIINLSITRDTAGVMGRSVKDIMLFDTIFSKCPRSYKKINLKGYRVGYPIDPWWTPIGEEAVANFKAALGAMTKAGVKFIPFSVSKWLNISYFNSPYLQGDGIFYTYDAPKDIARYLYYHQYNISTTELIDKIASPEVKGFYQFAATKSVDAFPTLNDIKKAYMTGVPFLQRAWSQFFAVNNVDIIVVPTTPIPARPIYDVVPNVKINGAYKPEYDVYGKTHQSDCTASIPGLTLPVGLTSYYDMPIGIQFHARSGQDDLLLSFGDAVEPLLPKTPAPPATPACTGCTPKAIPRSSAAGYQYILDLAGSCPLKKELKFPIYPSPEQVA